MIRTGKELATAAVNVAKNYKTLYVNGCFGAPLTEANKARWKNAQAYNRRADRAAKIDAARADTFGFDCVCFIKGLLWGWNGDANKQYGGTEYASNGVPDIGEDQMIAICSGVSTDFSAIEVGEVVWQPGHIGVYVGDGLAVECTPNWSDGVQITACNRDVAGYNRRNWVKHGKLPYVTYEGINDINTEEDNEMKLPELRKGAQGETVRAMQALLQLNDCELKEYGTDGDFGSETEMAVKKYQRKVCIDADGICGPVTWGKLLGV